ncbi:MAG: DUF2635 domain-containing protein [Aeromonadaceae bacterium]
MSNLKTVRPAAGRRIRHPDHSLLDDQGESVVWNSYWHRLHRVGDIEIVDEAEPAPQQVEVKPKAVKAKEQQHDSAV